ncbi:MAG: TIR domain-containing protein [Spirochaetes bacterium]|nr:TIR domain-containing protein [Spirochaetota bacterium]
MPFLRNYRVFISHAWDYNREYYNLERMLNDARNFDWSNYSVPEHDSLYTTNLKQSLRNQIKPTQIVIILSGMYATYREWIQEEIDLALEMNKPIIGVKLWGQERMPQIVRDYSDEIVGWNTPSIISAIRKHAI